MLKQVRAAEGNDLLVVCTCGKKTVLKFEHGNYQPVDKTWKHDQHGWSCGQKNHQQFFSKFTGSK